MDWGTGALIGLQLLGMYQGSQAASAQAQSRADIIAFNTRMAQMSADYGIKIGELQSEEVGRRSLRIKDWIKHREDQALDILNRQKNINKEIAERSGKFTESQITQKKGYGEKLIGGEADYSKEAINRAEALSVEDVTEKGK